VNYKTGLLGELNLLFLSPPSELIVLKIKKSLNLLEITYLVQELKQFENIDKMSCFISLELRIASGSSDKM
jgi:hypothetical protein